MKEKAAGGGTTHDFSAPDHATSERDEPSAAEDDESDLLRRPSAADGAGAGGTAVVSSGSLTLRQRVSLIVGLLRGPLLSSAAAVAGNFGITLALFPGVLTEMRSSNKSLDDWSVLAPPRSTALPQHPSRRLQVRHTARRLLQRV